MPTAQQLATDILDSIADRWPLACRRETRMSAAGLYFEAVRVYYCDIPGGVARIALDVAPLSPRNPAHEVRIVLDPPAPAGVTEEAAAIVVDALGNVTEL
jgi:hypothetical protein